jgi:hypothetical protein
VVFPGRKPSRDGLGVDFERTYLPGLSTTTGGRGGLIGAGPEDLQQPGQEVPVRIARGQVRPDASAGLSDAGPDLQELEPQGVDLSRSQFRALEVMAQQPKQAVGRGVEQQPELIGQEAMATQAVGLDLQLQFLEAVFHGSGPWDRPAAVSGSTF